MKRYKYRVVTLGRLEKVHLNYWGRRGYELVSIQGKGREKVAYMRRERRKGE